MCLGDECDEFQMKSKFLGLKTLKSAYTLYLNMTIQALTDE